MELHPDLYEEPFLVSKINFKIDEILMLGVAESYASVPP